MKDRKETCASCRWFIPPYVGATEARCRRYPPRVVPDDNGPDTFWPLVGSEDSCGEWTPKTNKTTKKKAVMQ